MCCLESQKMELFPVVHEGRIGTCSYSDVYKCRCPDDGTPMVQYDGKHCGEWFHISCINILIARSIKKASSFVECVHEQ